MLHNDDELLNDGNNHSQQENNKAKVKGKADTDKENSAKPNIPGPNEVPDQQKVGENTGDDEKYHVET